MTTYNHILKSQCIVLYTPLSTTEYTRTLSRKVEIEQTKNTSNEYAKVRQSIAAKAHTSRGTAEFCVLCTVPVSLVGAYSVYCALSLCPCVTHC